MVKVGIPTNRIPPQLLSDVDMARLRQLDTNHNRQLDIAELSEGLSWEPMRFRIGRLFEAGTAWAQRIDGTFQNSVYRTFLKMDTEDQFATLLSVNGWTQAQLIATLALSSPHNLSAGYLWSRLARSDNGVLGGIMMRSLWDYGPQIPNNIINDSRITALADPSMELRLKTHLDSVIPVHKKWAPLPKPNEPIHVQASYMGYFPTVSDARRYLTSQPSIVDSSTTLTPALKELQLGFFTGAVVAVVNGKGYVLAPKGKAPSVPQVTLEDELTKEALSGSEDELSESQEAHVGNLWKNIHDNSISRDDRMCMLEEFSQLNPTDFQTARHFFETCAGEHDSSNARRALRIYVNAKRRHWQIYNSDNGSSPIDPEAEYQFYLKDWKVPIE